MKSLLHLLPIASVASVFALTTCDSATLEDGRTILHSATESLTVCPATNVIADPPQFAWTFHEAANGVEAYYSGTLEVGEASFVIGSDTLTTRAYRQAGESYTIPGPTMSVVPGSKYVLSFHNTLPYEPLEEIHNKFKDPNVANLHTHGLHISGETPGDDVTRAFEGQRGGDFVYDIPADHMGGTFWYHAHHHGSTFLQVSGGMFGLLLVDDAADQIPAGVEAMVERQLVVAYLDPAVAGTGGDTLMSGTLSPTWTVNGLVQGSLCMPVDEWQHWRVLLADRDATDKTLGIGNGCEVQLLARDGVWRTTAPKALTSGEIRITGASRVDLAVRCSNDSVITVDNATVANVFVNGAGNTTVGPFSDGATGSTWSANRPAYLRDLSGVGNVNRETIRMGARAINGRSFEKDVPNLTLSADQVQEWTLKGTTQHPFHLHIYHLQSQDCTGDYEPGEYYDVITQSCTVRFDLAAMTSSPYAGRTILHCHILEHEDQGAMGWVDVIGGAPPPTFPDVQPPFSEYYALGGGPTPFCGDGTCNGAETQCDCPADCGTPPSSETACTDGADEDCDGDVDCDDSDCGADPACFSPCDGDSVCDPGEDCDNCASDCAFVKKGPPSGRYCCGNGVAEDGEGDGSICDGNY